jgi:catechol 2,3-dioxygenase-like lactoylglutathione lyase family enzyme
MHVRSLLLILAILACTACLLPARAIAADGDFSRTTIDLGMVVHDVDKSVAFYTQAVGFKELPGFQATGQFTGDAGLTDYQPVTVRVLVLGDGPTATRLKIMSLPAAAPKQGDNQFIHSELGFRYITIGVKDMTSALARLEKAGVKPLAKCPLALPKSPSGESYLTVCHDPDGNFIEFVGPKRK